MFAKNVEISTAAKYVSFIMTSLFKTLIIY